MLWYRKVGGASELWGDAYLLDGSTHQQRRRRKNGTGPEEKSGVNNLRDAIRVTLL
jgi:hypothetical protein